MKAVYAGSFSPPTMGHMDIITRAAGLYDFLVVAVMVHAEKNPAFTLDERVTMLRKITRHLPNVTVVGDEGLLVELAQKTGAGVLIRGIRGAEDVSYEMSMAYANRLIGGVETVFMSCSPEYSLLSSTIVRECAVHGASLKGMVPDEISEDILRAFRGR